MRRTLRPLPLALAAAVAAGGLTGCSSDDGATPTGSGGRLDLPAAVPRRAGGRRRTSTVTNLTSSARCRTTSSSPSPQTAALVDADVAVHLGGFQPAVDEAVEQNGPDRVLDVAAAADLLAADETEDARRALRRGRHADEAARPRRGGPALLARPRSGWRRRRRDRRASSVDASTPTGRGLRRQLRPAARPSSRARRPAVEQGSPPATIRTVVVSHDAFGYLAKYGLEFAPIAGLSPDAEPSPQHLAELQDLIREKGITTVFSETLASPAMAETLAGDLGLETAVLDPVEGLSDETAEEDYLSLMEQNLAALQKANRCQLTTDAHGDQRRRRRRRPRRPTRSCAASTSPCTAARSSPCSAPTVRASPPLSAPMLGLVPLRRGSVALYGTAAEGLPRLEPGRLRAAARHRHRRSTGLGVGGRRLRSGRAPAPAAADAPLRPAGGAGRDSRRSGSATAPRTAAPPSRAASSSAC